MNLILKILMFIGSGALIYNAAARPDNTLLISTIGVLLIMGAGFILIYRRGKEDN